MSENQEVQEVQEQQGPEKGSLDYAVAQLLTEEPEESATPESEEPEATEQTETEEVEVIEEEVEETELQESEVEYEEEEEVEEGEEPQTDYYQVKVAGEELEVTLDELQSGYQRQKDYTKKTQELAEQRKATESKEAELAELHQQALNQSVLANEVLNRELKQFEGVDWEALQAEDPTQYVAKKLAMQDITDRQSKLQAQAQQMYEHQQLLVQAEHEKAVEMERKKTLEAFPEWKDSTKAEAGQKMIKEYALGQGYSETELSNVFMARDVTILDKARKYDELMANQESITKKTVPQVRRKKVVKPKGAAPKGANKQRAVQDRRNQLAKSGSLRDAAALMNEMRTGNAIKK